MMPPQVLDGFTFRCSCSFCGKWFCLDGGRHDVFLDHFVDCATKDGNVDVAIFEYCFLNRCLYSDCQSWKSSNSARRMFYVSHLQKHAAATIDNGKNEWNMDLIPQFTCKDCNSVFGCVSHCSRHKSGRYSQCQKCQKNGAMSNVLANSNPETFMANQIVTKDEISKELSNLNYRVMKQSIKDGVCQLVYQCKICQASSKLYKRKEDVTQHLKKNHKNDSNGKSTATATSKKTKCQSKWKSKTATLKNGNDKYDANTKKNLSQSKILFAVTSKKKYSNTSVDQNKNGQKTERSKNKLSRSVIDDKYDNEGGKSFNKHDNESTMSSDENDNDDSSDSNRNDRTNVNKSRQKGNSNVKSKKRKKESKSNLSESNDGDNEPSNATSQIPKIGNEFENGNERKKKASVKRRKSNKEKKFDVDSRNDNRILSKSINNDNGNGTSETQLSDASLSKDSNFDLGFEQIGNNSNNRNIQAGTGLTVRNSIDVTNNSNSKLGNIGNGWNRNEKSKEWEKESKSGMKNGPSMIDNSNQIGNDCESNLSESNESDIDSTQMEIEIETENECQSESSNTTAQRRKVRNEFENETKRKKKQLANNKGMKQLKQENTFDINMENMIGNRNGNDGNTRNANNGGNNQSQSNHNTQFYSYSQPVTPFGRKQRMRLSATRASQTYRYEMLNNNGSTNVDILPNCNNDNNDNSSNGNGNNMSDAIRPAIVNSHQNEIIYHNERNQRRSRYSTHGGSAAGVASTNGNTAATQHANNGARNGSNNQYNDLYDNSPNGRLNKQISKYTYDHGACEARSRNSRDDGGAGMAARQEANNGASNNLSDKIRIRESVFENVKSNVLESKENDVNVNIVARAIMDYLFGSDTNLGCDMLSWAKEIGKNNSKSEAQMTSFRVPNEIIEFGRSNLMLSLDKIDNGQFYSHCDSHGVTGFGGTGASASNNANVKGTSFSLENSFLSKENESIVNENTKCNSYSYSHSYSRPVNSEVCDKPRRVNAPNLSNLNTIDENSKYDNENDMPSRKRQRLNSIVENSGLPVVVNIFNIDQIVSLLIYVYSLYF